MNSKNKNKNTTKHIVVLPINKLVKTNITPINKFNGDIRAFGVRSSKESRF